MSLALLSTVPNTKGLLRSWSFSHMAHHRDIIRRIREVKGYRLEEYIIDPIDMGDPAAMLRNHQAMHNDMNAVFGLSGNDLLEVDFRDVEQLAAWIFFNFNEHQQVSKITGV